MTEQEIIIGSEYPILENKVSKWTREFRCEWNKQYREGVKAGTITPTRHKTDSKWEDPEFRRAYDVSRNTKLAEEKQEKKVSFEAVKNRNGKRPNYSNEERAQILKKMLEAIKNGNEAPDHPYLEITLHYKNKRDYSTTKTRD